MRVLVWVWCMLRASGVHGQLQAEFTWPLSDITWFSADLVVKKRSRQLEPSGYQDSCFKVLGLKTTLCRAFGLF